jgi:hypothetical protein
MWSDSAPAVEPFTRTVSDGSGRAGSTHTIKVDTRPEMTIAERRRLESFRAAQARYPGRKLKIPHDLQIAAAPSKRMFPRVFEPEHVNVLQRMCARHYPEPHRFICISDSGEGLDPAVEWLPTPLEAQKFASLESPEGRNFPSCYRRLWVFSEAAKILGDRILCTDIDAVITGDLTPLMEGPEQFMGWRPFRDWGRKLRFGGGTYRLDTGTRTQVWDQFDGERAILLARHAGFRGSDQAWISYQLAEHEPYWGLDSGIYSVRDLGPGLGLPSDARLVHFNGHHKPPHHKEGRVAPVQWVLDNWR